MEKEEIVTVQNTGDKGNPNHVPAGSPEGGQFTSADKGFTVSKANIMDFLAKKQSGTVTNAPVQTESAPEMPKKDYSQSINSVLVPSVKDEYLKKGVVDAFNHGRDEAKDAVLSVLKDYGVTINKGSGSCYDGWGHVVFSNTDLTSSGKYGGYHAPGETFYHECFHAIDGKFYKNGKGGYLTSNYQLENGKTLRNVFHDEIAEHKYGHNLEMYNEIKAEYKARCEEELHKFYSDEEIDQIRKDLNCQNELNKKYKYLSGTSLNGQYKQDWIDYKNERKRLFKEVLNPAMAKYDKAVNVVNHEYSCLSDFCSYLYKTGVGEGSICGGHKASYWSQDWGQKPIREMFAELGSMWSRNDTAGIDRIKKYFPKTVEGFMEIVNNFDKIRSV